MDVRRNLPRNLRDKRWVKRTPPSLAKTSSILHKLCRRNMALKYRLALTPQRRALLNMKWQASMLFRGKKASYPASVAVPFTGTHIEESDQPAVAAAFKKSQAEGDRKMLYSTIVHKVCVCAMVGGANSLSFKGVLTIFSPTSPSSPSSHGRHRLSSLPALRLIATTMAIRVTMWLL